MKNNILKLSTFTAIFYATASAATTSLEGEIQQRNTEYLDLFFYAISLDPTLATEKTVQNYINFIKPTEINNTVNEFELHELYANQRKILTQKTSDYKFDTTKPLQITLGSYNFENSSFPLIYSMAGDKQDIYLPCLKYGLRQSCQQRHPLHGMPTTISISFSTGFPNEISISPEKAKTLVSLPGSRHLVSDVQYKTGFVKVHNEKYRPLEWEIILIPKSYTISTSSQEVLLEKKTQ